MTDKEMAKQFADNISGFETTCSLLSSKDKSCAYRLGRYDGFLAGLEAGRPKWHFIKDKDFPTKEGIYLTWRHFGSDKYPQILAFDGKYWVVGNDHPDNMIIAWQEIIPPKELDDDN